MTIAALPTTRRRRLLALAAACAAALVSVDAAAGTASTSFTVTGTVTANCTIAATGLNFTYDPVVANATVNATATGNLTLACTKGSAPVIGLSLGNNAGKGPTGPRSMLSGTASYLGYDIYQPGTTTSWTTTATYTPPAPASKAPQTIVVNGVVFAGQDVAVGSYADTVTATVNF